MFNYFLRRLSLLFTTLIIISLIAYLLEINLVRYQHHDIHFWRGFFSFINHSLHGDFGFDKNGDLIITQLAYYLPATLELCITSFILSMLIGVPLGTLSGISENSAFRPVIITFSQLIFSIPVFWMALLAVSYFSLNVGELPVSGRHSLIYEIEPVTGFLLIDSLLDDSHYRWIAFFDALKHLALPTLVLTTIPTTEVIRQLSRSVSDVMKQNYIKAAATKGLSKWKIIRLHVLRNALPPIFPIISLQFGSVLTMAMIIETIFAWPGVGSWLLHSIFTEDYKVISVCLLIIASFVILANVVTELLTAMLHPLMRKALYDQ